MVNYSAFGGREENWRERNGKVDISHFTLCTFGDITDNFAVLLFLAKSVWPHSEPL